MTPYQKKIVLGVTSASRGPSRYVAASVYIRIQVEIIFLLG